MCVIKYYCYTDHCLEAGIEDGFNCMSEMKCIPQVYECDGVPDCVTQLIALDETECNGR